MSALQRNCDKRSHMTHKMRKAWLENLFKQLLFVDLIKHFGSSSKIVNILGISLRGNYTTLCLLGARVIYIVKNRLPMLFTRLKQNR